VTQMDAATANRKYHMLLSCVETVEHGLIAEIKATDGYLRAHGQTPDAYGSFKENGAGDPYAWHKGRLQALKSALTDVRRKTGVYVGEC
jgi:hypothetical protein